MKSVRLLTATLAMLVVATSCSNNASNPASPQVPTDGAPLTAPSDLTIGTSAGTGGDVLRFTPSASASVAGYELYQYSPSPSRDNSYALMATLRANVTEYELPAAPANSIEYWRVVAISQSGSRSPNSPTLTARRREAGVPGHFDPPHGPHDLGGLDD